MIGAAMVGVMRHTQNVKLGLGATFGERPELAWQRHIEGALTEAALAKSLGRYWLGTGKWKDPDVGDVDVRATHRPNGRLIIHKEDPEDRRFYFMTGLNGSYELRGWIMGRDAKRDEWWTDPVGGRPAYFVPIAALNPITDCAT
jgi:hypothetical protein